MPSVDQITLFEKGHFLLHFLILDRHELLLYALFFFFRRQLDYQDVLDNLKSKGISIRVASPKLVMEEVRFSHIWGFQGQYPFALFCKVFSLIVADHFCFVLANLYGFLLPLLPPLCHVWVCR